MEPDSPHPLVVLARKAIVSHLRKESPPGPEDLPFPGDAAGTFVSLKKGGQLRGCIGTLAPVRPSLSEEVAENAVSAATRDPRFQPVTLEEMDEITISVDVLGPAEPVTDLSDLDPSRYGVIVRSGWRKGVLLPDLPGVNTAREQVHIARQKAGIGEGEPVELKRFEVKRYY